MKESKTLGKEAKFSYEEKITITYGATRSASSSFTLDKLSKLLGHFKKQKQPIEIGYARPVKTKETAATQKINTKGLPKDSLGFWLVQNVSKTNLVPYITAILIENGFAEHEIIDGKGFIRFLNI